MTQPTTEHLTADELDALHAAPDHVLDGVAAGPADADHLDDRAARFGFKLAPQTLRWSDNLVVRGLHALELELGNP